MGLNLRVAAKVLAGLAVTVIAPAAVSQPSMPDVTEQAPAPPVHHDAAIARAVRGRLLTFARDFNQGHVDALLQQYDRSFIGILGTEILSYAEYTQRVREMFATPPHPRFAIDPREVRVLSPEIAVVNGYATTTPAGRPPEKEVFTVIYRFIGREWRLIYAHSSLY